ncbi:cytochrome c553 [Shewanella psychrophila]|uniref:Cytochrome c553 n=1 Tax=Shewanella psychrophila TaxID=225848 RepID=A0A1S6HIA8_9GAMM|nr:c-type cytochrome [Shewanella psychrophila]AQS35263.1 cytochrome c553 [Shewanella psychrophila]
MPMFNLRSAEHRLSLILSSLVMLTVLAPSAAQAGESPQLLNMCIACHGAVGTNDFPNIADLRWQNQEYLVKQLQAFKSGERSDKTMSKVAQLLTDEDMQSLAQYFYTGENK